MMTKEQVQTIRDNGGQGLTLLHRDDRDALCDTIFELAKIGSDLRKRLRLFAVQTHTAWTDAALAYECWRNCENCHTSGPRKVGSVATTIEPELEESHKEGCACRPMEGDL